MSAQLAFEDTFAAYLERCGYKEVTSVSITLPLMHIPLAEPPLYDSIEVISVQQFDRLHARQERSETVSVKECDEMRKFYFLQRVRNPDALGADLERVWNDWYEGQDGQRRIQHISDLKRKSVLQVFASEAEKHAYCLDNIGQSAVRHKAVKVLLDTLGITDLTKPQALESSRVLALEPFSESLRKTFGVVDEGLKKRKQRNQETVREMSPFLKLAHLADKILSSYCGASAKTSSKRVMTAGVREYVSCATYEPGEIAVLWIAV